MNIRWIIPSKNGFDKKNRTLHSLLSHLSFMFIELYDTQQAIGTKKDAETSTGYGGD